MALDPRIPLSVRAPDLSSIQSGITNAFQLQEFQQQSQLNQQQLLQNKFKALDVRQQKVTNSLIQGAARLESLVDENDDIGIEFALNQRIRRLNEVGVDSNDTQKELQSFKDNPAQFKKNVKSAIQLGERLGLLKPTKQQEPFTLKEGEQRFDPQGRVIAQVAQEQKSFTLGEGEKRFDTQGNIIAQGAKKEDKAPTGFRFTQGGNLEPIPGGKADFERQQGVERITKSIDLAEVKSKLVIGKVDEALNTIEKEFGVTGFTGKVSAIVGGTDAFSLRKNLETIQANLGFDTLQRMRDASPTGGALGQVSERELDLLVSAVASLDIGQTKDRLVKNLGEVRTHYENWLKAVKKANTQGGQAQTQTKIRSFNPQTGKIE